MAPSYKLWHAEKKAPTPEDRRADRPTDPMLMSGFWRINASRTKPDWPVAIWTQEGQEATIFQIGRKVMNTVENAQEWADFTAGAWLKCTAVEQADWSAALETSRWADGKPSREITEAEKADIIPTTPSEQGGNQPVDENGEPIDEFWLQIKQGLERCTEQIKALGNIDSLETANKAAEIIERISALSSQGETKRKEEKKPFDDGAAKVQAKWVPILNPASELRKNTIAAIDRWKKAEEKRLAAEAEKKRREEAARIAAEREEQLRREAEERARQAEQMGMEAQGPTEEEIAQQAQAEAEQQVAEQMPQADTKVRVGTAHGRAVSRAKIKRGVITDVDKFFSAIKDHQITQEFLQQRANAIARAGVPADGMEIIEE
jgi:flagellar biosynthesis GTPase FlhF